MKDDEGALLRLERAEGLLEQIPVGDLVRDVRCRWPIVRKELDLDQATSGGLDGSVHGDSMQPGVPAVRIAQSGKVAPGAHQSLLDRVARKLRVPEDESGYRVQSRDGSSGQHGKGVMIAPPG
jgi:hypothetical protein